MNPQKACGAGIILAMMFFLQACSAQDTLLRRRAQESSQIHRARFFS
jgi:hypothetical protein